MNIAIVGTGYVGLVSGTCFADTGANVTCVDVDAQKIERLKNGEIPIFEPGLDELVKKNVAAGRLKFTTDLSSVLDDVQIVFSAVGTPPDEDGSADLKYVLQVARTIGQHLLGMLTLNTNHHTVGRHEVLDGITLLEELRVGSYIELNIDTTLLQLVLDGLAHLLGGTYGNS